MLFSFGRIALVLFRLIRTGSRLQRENKTVVDLFDETVARRPEKTAIVFEKQKWTFRQLQSFTFKVANYFKSIGISEGDTIALMAQNCPEYVGLWLGIARIGACTALINYNLRTSVLVHSISVSKAKGLIFPEELCQVLGGVRADLLEEMGPSFAFYCLDGAAPELEGVHLGDQLERASEVVVPPRANKRSNGESFVQFHCIAFLCELCLVQICSCTSTHLALPDLPRRPRLCITGTVALGCECDDHMTSHDILNCRYMWMANGLAWTFRIHSDDIIYCSLPLYHTNGGVLGVGQMIINGSTIAIRKKFSASKFWEDCATYGCTVSEQGSCDYHVI